MYITNNFVVLLRILILENPAIGWMEIEYERNN
jgi:hypothetical protein